MGVKKLKASPDVLALNRYLHRLDGQTGGEVMSRFPKECHERVRLFHTALVEVALIRVFVGKKNVKEFRASVKDGGMTAIQLPGTATFEKPGATYVDS
jgi:hypothetical protein